MTTIHPIFTLRREVDRLFDEAFAPAFGRDPQGAAWAPAADVRESGDAWLIEVELAGVDPAAVEVTSDRGVLTVRGEKRAALREGENARIVAGERIHGRFVRTFRLPKGLDEGAITAEFEHGLLRLRLPKAAVPQPRRIAVSLAGNAPAVGGPGANGADAAAPSALEAGSN